MFSDDVIPVIQAGFVIGPALASRVTTQHNPLSLAHLVAVEEHHHDEAHTH